jgi:hypothetical protein
MVFHIIDVVDNLSIHLVEDAWLVSILDDYEWS